MSFAFIRPALPLHTAGPYVFAAYIIFVLLILIYVGIMALRLGRNEKAIEDLAVLMRERGLDGDQGGQILDDHSSDDAAAAADSRRETEPVS